MTRIQEGQKCLGLRFLPGTHSSLAQLVAQRERERRGSPEAGQVQMVVGRVMGIGSRYGRMAFQ